jgi:hypothetical protein
MMIEERECATRWRSNDLETGGRVFPTSEFAPAAGGGHGSNSQQRRRPRAWYPEVRFSQRKSFDVDSIGSSQVPEAGGRRVRVVHRCGFRVTVDYSLHRNTRIILSHSVAVRFALVGYCCARSSCSAGAQGASPRTAVRTAHALLAEWRAAFQGRPSLT